MRFPCTPQWSWFPHNALFTLIPVTKNTAEFSFRVSAVTLSLPSHKATKEQKQSMQETCSSFNFPHIGLLSLRLLSPQAVVCFILSRVCWCSLQEDQLFKSSFLHKSRNLSKASSSLLSPELIALSSYLLFLPAFLFLLCFPWSLLLWSLLYFSVILGGILNSEVLEDTSL